MQASSRLSVVLWTTDIDALSLFLTRVAGLDEVVRHPGYAELTAGSGQIVLQSDEAMRGHPWYAALQKEGVARGIGAEVRLEVDDVQAAFVRANQLGALNIAPPYALEGGSECQVMGPDGYLFTMWAVA